MRSHAIAILAGALSFAAAPPVSAQETIRIGELNSYKSQPAFLEPYKKGLDMAADEINKSGGVLGKKLEIVSRDVNGDNIVDLVVSAAWLKSPVATRTGFAPAWKLREI